MPAAIPIAVAVMAASQGYQMYQANQERQHAEGAAEAQKTAMDAQVADQKKQDDANAKAKSDSAAAASATSANTAADMNIARLRSLTGGSGSIQSSILTSPLGASAAPTATHTLLGA